MSHIGHAVALTDRTRPVFQHIIPEPIPETAKWLLLTKDGYLMFAQNPVSETGLPRVPQFVLMSCMEIEIED